MMSPAQKERNVLCSSCRRHIPILLHVGPTWRTRGAVASRHLASRRPATPAAPPLLSCPPIRARPLPLDCNQETKLPRCRPPFPNSHHRPRIRSHGYSGRRSAKTTHPWPWSVLRPSSFPWPGGRRRFLRALLLRGGSCIQAQDMDQSKENAKFPSCDAYFEAIQSKKKLPLSLQESLTAAFAQIPVSSFPEVPTGRVIEIPGDTSVIEAVRILSEHNIRAAPVLNPEPGALADWQGRYLGVIDYSAIILWVLENAELASVALSAGSATAAGVRMGAVGAVGVAALGATGPAAVAGLTAAAVGAAVAGGLTAEKGVAKDGLAAADHLGEDLYKILLEQEPFKSTTVRSIVESYRWSPFVPITLDSSMLTVLLLLSKYRLRNVPVIEPDKPVIRNFITQTGVVKGLQQCKGRDWFDYISALPLSDLGLPFMSIDEVITVKSDDLILEAFKCMKDNKIGGVPVVEGPKRKLVGSVSIRDIRFLLLRPDLFSNFRQLTVIDFMKTLGSTLPDSGNSCLVKPPPTCAPDTSLGSVIDSIASRITHRIYVVDGDLEVVGVVTLRDVISCFIHEPPGYCDIYLASANVGEAGGQRSQISGES